MTAFIYGLVCPVAETIRYIGKSTSPKKRFASHVSGAARGAYQHHTARWIAGLLAAGLVPELVILHTVADGERWQDVERAFIASAEERGWVLTNSTEGGEGLDYRDSEAAQRYRDKMSAVMKDVWSTPERKLEASQRSFKAWADPEITERRIASMRAAQNEPALKAHLSEVKKEIHSRPSVVAAKRAGSQKAWLDPDYRGRVTAARNDPKFTIGQADRLAKRWADPADRQKMTVARWTDDKRVEQAERIKARNLKTKPDPEMVARRNASIKASWARRKEASALSQPKEAPT